jgi:histidyl-tRNA synthetase
LDAEIIGAAEPQADVEILSFGSQLLTELGISDGVTLKLNSLGDSASRDAWRARLIEHFSGQDISPESRVRLAKNPLRVLDSKDPRDQAAVKGAPRCSRRRSRGFFRKVRGGWMQQASRIARSAPRARADYIHIAFEFVSTPRRAGRGIAGGRYDADRIPAVHRRRSRVAGIERCQ